MGLELPPGISIECVSLWSKEKRFKHGLDASWLPLMGKQTEISTW